VTIVSSFLLLKLSSFLQKQEKKIWKKIKDKSKQQIFLVEDTNRRDYTEEGFHAITAGRSFQFQLSNLNLMYAIILY
jgi:hypothetical protein